MHGPPLACRNVHPTSQARAALECCRASACVCLARTPNRLAVGSTIVITRAARHKAAACRQPSAAATADDGPCQTVRIATLQGCKLTWKLVQALYWPQKSAERAGSYFALAARSTQPGRRRHNAGHSGYPCGPRGCPLAVSLLAGELGELHGEAPLPASRPARLPADHIVFSLCRVTMPRTSTAQRLAVRRPQQLQSEFLSPVASLKGLCASFARENRRCAVRRDWPASTLTYLWHGRQHTARQRARVAAFMPSCWLLLRLHHVCRDGPGCGVQAGAGRPQRPAGGVQQQEGPGLHAARHPPVRTS